MMPFGQDVLDSGLQGVRCGDSPARKMPRQPLPSRRRLAGLIAPMALAVAGLGCVNLDKPESVAACSSGVNGPCRDNPQPDAAEVRDARNDATAAPDAGPDSVVPISPGDARIETDVLAFGDVRQENDAAVPVTPDAGQDIGKTTQPDASASDARVAEDVAADLPVADVRGADGTAASPEAPVVLPDTGLPDVIDTSDAVSTPDNSAVTDTVASPDKPDVATTVITFKSGRGNGIMTGYGWVTLGASDTVTSPTCGATNAAITSASSCSTQTNWNSSTALCVTGSIPALPEVPSATDYTNNWGIQVGVNAKEPNAAIGQSFDTIALNLSGTPTSGLRIELHRSGDAVGTTYCALWTSSDPVPLTSFNTECWNDGGVAMTAADVPNIDKVGLQVTSGSAPITVTDLCIQSIVFGK
jgi:hypothetical protein